MSSMIRLPLVKEDKDESLSMVDNNLRLPERTTSRIPSPPLMEQARLLSRPKSELEPSKFEGKERNETIHRAKFRAVSSNHDCPNPRREGDSAVVSREKNNRDDTYLECNLVTKQQEIPYSSPVDRACHQRRNPPMKRAQIAIPVIRIPKGPPIQITVLKQKPSTDNANVILTDTNHITQNNTANSVSTKTGNQKNTASMAVLPCSNEAVANSSTTESSPSSASSAIASPSKATSGSETMTAAGKVVEKAQQQCKIPSETNDNRILLASQLQSQQISKAPSLPLNTTNTTTITNLNAEREIETSQKSQTKHHERISIINSSTTSVNVNTTNKERIEPSTKHETPKMSVIKASVVQQTVSSASAAAFPSFPLKTAPTSIDNGIDNGIANANNRSKTLSSPAAAKKKKPSSGNKRKRTGSSPSTSQKSKGQSSGRWTQEEHQAFLEGLTECGREWKKVALRIPTRTSAQIRSHAQKYFAKLQRDQESSATNPTAGYGHSDVAAPLTPVGPGLVLGAGGLTGTIITSPGAATLPLSVQRNVERIVSNPRAAQREVEDTMEALRERYRQLQQRLEERRRNRQAHKTIREQQKSLSSASSNTASFASPLRQNQLNGSPLNRNQLSSHRKQASSPTGADDGSSVCSSVSSIAASRTDLGNEEIIALQVLGDTLPRSESTNSLQHPVTEKENNRSNGGSHTPASA